MDFTTTGLFASIRRRASIPTTSVTGGANADLLAYANEELRLGLIAEILKLREGYFKRDSDTAISGTTYRIPARAIGGKLAGVYLLDSSSRVMGDPLPEIQDERQGNYDPGSSVCGYRVKGNDIVLVPTATTGASYIRMVYYEQPNEIVSTAYAVITSITTATNTIAFASTAFPNATADLGKFDLIASKEGFHNLAVDMATLTYGASAVTSIAFTTTLPSGLAVGDYVASVRTSPVPQIPSEFHPILAQCVACSWLEAAGFKDQLESARQKLGQMMSAIGTLSSPRVDTGSKKMIQRFSVLGSIPGGRRGGG